MTARLTNHPMAFDRCRSTSLVWAGVGASVPVAVITPQLKCDSTLYGYGSGRALASSRRAV